MPRLLSAALLVALIVSAILAQKPPEYAKKADRAATIQALLAADGLPDLGGKWRFAGPFAFDGEAGFDQSHPPEKGVDLTATYKGKNGVQVVWRDLARFQYGRVFDLQPLCPNERTDAAVYLAHEFDSPRAFALPLSLGSDDTISVWFNGTRVLHENHVRPAAADQHRIELKVKAGKNTLLLKVGQYAGGWEVYVAPEAVAAWPEGVRKQLDRDFPAQQAVNPGGSAKTGDEARYYALDTFPLSEDCVLEVGGLSFAPNGDLFACTRRGEVWRVKGAGGDVKQAKFSRFAAGLHEALGVAALDDETLVVAQRPELSRLRDTRRAGTADSFETICDKWGISGDYHEYCFGPAIEYSYGPLGAAERKTVGNYFLTLNVGFGGGHQAKAAWRGWCVKVSPTGEMTPFAYGLRSPNGVAFSPDGELFYTDNQGEWCASNKLCHLREGKFYGHQAPLKWVKDSPFAGKVPETVPSNIRYDGVNPAKPDAPRAYPAVEPPCVWFPYGRMGQSVSAPAWDTTAGKFGPFAGHIFAGDQTRSVVMRVALDKVDGQYQGACFPFRGGFQCGVNRVCFGPDGALYVGETSRGWGSVGGKPYGLERLTFTGKTPPEMHSVKLAPDGFDVAFTVPVDPATLAKPDAVSAKSFTYVYHSQYGCPETDSRAEPVTAVSVRPDGKGFRLRGPKPEPGRVYELRLSGVAAATGEALVHAEAYYTVNRLAK